MTPRKELHTELIREYRKTLNPKSKFFYQDLQDFASRIEGDSDERNGERLNNLRQLNNPHSTLSRQVEAEVEKLDRAGMYNVRNMQPKNQLD